MLRTRRKAWALLAVITLVVASCEFEAELPKEVSGDVDFIDEGSASNGQFARIGPGGSTSYEFNVNPNYQSSPQIIWVRTRCTEPTATLAVTVDGGAPVPWPDPCIPDDSGPDPDGWSWTRVSSPSSTPSTFDMTAPGAHEVAFAGTGGQVDIDKVWVGPVGSGSPTGKGNYGKGIETLTVEVESADPVAGWAPFDDPDARGGAALLSTATQWLLQEPPEFGPETITLETTVAHAGTYTFWARGIRPGSFTGQMWVRVNEGTPQRLSIGSAGRWTWSRLSTLAPTAPAQFALAEGPVTIEIRAALPGFSLDQLVLTNGKHYLPSLARVMDPVDDVWPAGGAFDLVTEGDHQYVAYYNKDARITVKHRRLNQGGWKTKTLPGARALFTKLEGFDTHNYLTMAVDGAGNLHVAGNMHVEPMTYYRTTVPHDITTLAPGAMPEAEPGRTTYPEFIESADPDELFIKYRGGTSADGEEYLNRYDVSTGQWSTLQPEGTPAAAVPVPLLAACATCQYPNPCPAGCQREYAYNKILFDGTRYHLAWIWRTWDYNNRTNVISSHDISYAWSYDLRDWFLASDTEGEDPLDWPLTFDGPKGYSDRAAPVLDPPQDPKVIEWLPPGTDNPADGVAMRLGGGLHNSLFEISVTPSGDPVVSYSKFVYRQNNGVTEVDSVVVNARLTPAGEWQRHELAVGVPCPQTTTPDEVGPRNRAIPGRLVVEPDASLSEQVRTCNSSAFQTNYRLDPVTAAFGIARQYPKYNLVPAEIKELEAARTRRDFCGDAAGFDAELDTAVNPLTVLGRGEATGGRQFFLRWNRTPSVDFARPDYCHADPLMPSQLRVYEASP